MDKIWMRIHKLAVANNRFIRTTQVEKRGISWSMLVSILMVCING